MAWGMSGRVQVMMPKCSVLLGRCFCSAVCLRYAVRGLLQETLQMRGRCHCRRRGMCRLTPRSAKIWMRSEMHGKAPVCQHKLPRSNHHLPALQPSAEDLLARRRRPEALSTAITIGLLAPKGLY